MITLTGLTSSTDCNAIIISLLIKPKGQGLVLFQTQEKQIPTSALQPFLTGYRLANTNGSKFVYFMKGK